MTTPKTLAALIGALICAAAPLTTGLASAPAWTSLAALPSGVGSPAAATAPCMKNTTKNCIYSLGGMADASNAYSTARMFSPATGVWSTVASMKAGRSALSATKGPCTGAVSRSCLYAIGGVNSGGASLASAEMYDPTVNKWSSIAALPTPGASSVQPGRFAGAAATAPCFTHTGKNCIYEVGGYNESIFTLNSVQMYDPATKTWQVAASLNIKRSRLAAATGPCWGNLTHTCIYAIGGTGLTGILSSVEMYSPTTNTWTTVAQMPQQSSPTKAESIAGMGAAGAACVGNTAHTCVYIFGGQDQSLAITGSTLMYDPTANAWSYLAPLAHVRDNLGGTRGPCSLHTAKSCLYAIGGSGQDYFTTVESYQP